jgi:hypothetical protein
MIRRDARLTALVWSQIAPGVFDWGGGVPKLLSASGWGL